MSNYPKQTHFAPRSTAALLLPGYSPDLTWMLRARHAGTLILDDLHPFSRKSKVHRTRIRTPNAHQWLSIPIVPEDRRKSIRFVRIDDRRPWLSHHLRALTINYRGSLYFDFYEPEIRADLTRASECGLLAEAVRHLMERQWTYLELPGSPVWASRLVDSERTDDDTDDDARNRLYRLISDRFRTVWQESGSRHYQKPHPLLIGHDPAETNLPEYHQHFPGFVPGCGVLDLLFEYGPDAWQVLDRLTVSGDG